MIQKSAKPKLAAIGLAVAACLLWTTPALEDRMSQTHVPEPLRAALELLWEHLNPYHERAVTKGYGGLLISAGFDGKPSKWRVHLRTIIDYGSCHGHPEAIKMLYRLDGPVAVPFLSNSHRLFLEWRALHAGLRLGFLEKVGPIAAMPPVTRPGTAYERPTALHAKTRTAEEVFGEDEAWLIEVSDHLRAKRFKPAMRKIDRLGWMCLGYRKPDRKPLTFPKNIRFDPADVRHPAG